MAIAGTLKIVFPSGNDNSKFSIISTARECNSITLEIRTSAPGPRSLNLKRWAHENFQPMQARAPAAKREHWHVSVLIVADQGAKTYRKSGRHHKHRQWERLPSFGGSGTSMD